MFLFCPVEVDFEADAHAWHLTSTKTDRSIFPRSADKFFQFVAQGQVWCVLQDSKRFSGLAYAAPEAGTWEIGGLTVEEDARRLGVGLVLACVTLGNLLFEEDPLADEPPGPLRIVAHVLKSNPKPLSIVEKILQFRLRGSHIVHGRELPGLETDLDGFVHGDEYEIGLPETLEFLASWVEGWDDQLRTGVPAVIRLRTGSSLAQWPEAFRRMAARYV